MELLFIVFLFGFVCAGDYNTDFRRLDSIWQEQPCTAAGGLCTIAADCPNGQLVRQKGLCPKQRSKGIECCNGFSVKETRCGKRGGECMTNDCGVVFKEATDCSHGSRCCIFVN